MNADFWFGEWSYLYLFLAGFCATQPWRYLGVMLSRDISLDSEILVWVNLVSTALVAGLVSRLVLFPSGVTAAVPMELRLLAMAAGIGVFLLARRSMGVGVIAGVAVLIAGQWLTG